MNCCIEVKDLSKRFGNLKAVDMVSFQVYEGEIFGLLGPNGAGKSTLISMLTTLLKPDSGEIRIGGHDLKSHQKQVKELMGLVPQEIALYPSLTARENLMFWGRMYGLGGKQLKERVDEALEIAGLTKRAKDRIDRYSGGMKRRINIAAALLHHPKILIMDEPTVGIDPQSRSHILETVLRLNKEGMTILYTSHYMEEVEYLCHRVAIMDFGKIIALGTRDELGKLVGENDVINIDAQNAGEEVLKKLSSLEGVLRVSEEKGKVKLIVNGAGRMLASIVSVFDNGQCRINSIKTEESNLESVFLYLTGRALRD